MKTLNELKNLAVKLGCAESASAVTGKTIDEVIKFIYDNYKVPAAPSTAGTYNLVISSEGTATWTAVI